MNITYSLDTSVSLEHFLSLLHSSGLAERRPIDNETCLKGMLKNSNLMVTAWDNTKLIGIARCMTDFHYACYLSDLAVDAAYQHLGIGKALQAKVKASLHNTCKLILISAPDANDYYPHIGYTHNDRCWVLDGDQFIR